MPISTGGLRVAGLALALVLTVRVAAAQGGDRMGAVVAARVDLQRQLAEWLTKSLTGVAEPYRVDVVVRVDMRGSVRELRAKQQTATPTVKIGGKNKVKLPGLGMVDGGGAPTNILPEINIEGGSRVSETVSRQLETEVSKLTILLLVDAGMPQERRDLLVRLAADLAGIDRARGDDIVVEERPAPPGAAGPGSPAVVQATLQAGPSGAVGLLVICGTVVIAAAILAFGLSRRAGGSATTIGMVGGRGGDERDGSAAAGDAAAASTPESVERRKRREELGAFKALADATPRELVQVMAEADPHTAAAVADLVGFDAESAKLVETMIPPQRRVEIGIGLDTSRVMSRDQLAQLEGIAAQLLQRIRSRVQLGGASRLADFLALAPPAVRREVLEGVGARDRALAQSARDSLLLFEDLPRLSDAALRQVATAVDPGVLALALAGAPEIGERVLGAVSKRLRSILEAEGELVEAKPPEEIETARRAVEDVMRQLGTKGELQDRAA